MTAPVRIEAEAWTDLRFATLARLLRLAEPVDALIRTARLWGWQTEHYTPAAPTYVVDLDTVESAIGPGAAEALVRARLAEELPEGYRIRGSAGRIEWLWRLRQSARAGGEATSRKRRHNQPPDGAPIGSPIAAPAVAPMASPLIPVPIPVPEDQSSLPRAIPPAPVAPPAPSERQEARLLWRELEQARTEAAAELGVEIQVLAIGDPGERDLADLVAAARSRGPAELATLVGQARHAIAMAKHETASGAKPFEWFTGAVFAERNFRRLVGKTQSPTWRAGPRGSAERAEPVRKIKTL